MLDFSLSEEQKSLVETARRFTQERIIPIAAEADRTEQFPKEVYEEAWRLGIVAPVIPGEYGGSGLGGVDNALINEELAYGCSGIQTSISATTLAAMPIILGGSDAQKTKYLGMLTASPCYASYATTEPSAGSDVAGMRTTATKHGNTWVLRGEKCFITNASLARFYVVFATTDPEKRHKGIAAFIVDRDARGFTVGKKEEKLGQRASDTATIAFEDVEVPESNVLAREGDGFRLAMATFDRTRPDVGAAAAGVIRRCIDESARYAQERKTFGQSIANHQAVQFMIAEMAMRYEATRLLTLKAAWMIEQGAKSSIVSSYAKALGADAAMQSATDAVQIFGGNGFMRDYPVEKLMRDAKVLQIYEGTSQIQRMVIAKHVFAGAR